MCSEVLDRQNHRLRKLDEVPKSLVSPSDYEALPYNDMIVEAGLGSGEPRIGMAPFITRSLYDVEEPGTCRRLEMVKGISTFATSSLGQRGI